MSSKACIICVAITGSLPRKSNNARGADYHC